MSVIRPQALALDLGASKTAVAALFTQRIVVSRFVTPEADGFEEGLKQFSDWAGAVPLGLSRAPALDAAGCVTDWPSRPNWQGADLMAMLNGAFGPSQIYDYDDGACAALYEQNTLCHSGTVAALSIGTGLAIGAARQGTPTSLGNGVGTLGHTALAGFDGLCRCGARGCLQAALAPVDRLIDQTHGGRALRRAIDLVRDVANADAVVLTGGRLPALRTEFADIFVDLGHDAVQYSTNPNHSAVLGALLLAGGLGRVRAGFGGQDLIVEQSFVGPVGEA